MCGKFFAIEKTPIIILVTATTDSMPAQCHAVTMGSVCFENICIAITRTTPSGYKYHYLVVCVKLFNIDQINFTLIITTRFSTGGKLYHGTLHNLHDNIEM